MSLADIRTSLAQELKSWQSPPQKDVSTVPRVGDKAPTSEKLSFFQHKPTLVVFLRHCGCPFAEKTFKNLTKVSSVHKELRCIAVSHSSREATEKWVIQVGGDWEVEVIVDEERDLYAAWGLGVSSAWHAVNPWAIYSMVRLGREEGIWNRATESGSRWQTSGAFAVDTTGHVRWESIARAADDVPDFADALKALEPST